jgi:hypothetical protein
MLSGTHLLACTLILGATAIPLRAATDTFIESADGKRLVRLESPELDKPYKAVSIEASGKTVVYVHDNEILVDIHAPALFVVDGDVRHTSAGVKIATFDGQDIRHGAGGKVVMNYHHPDLSPDSHANRLYRVNGPELTQAQLVAVLYALQPDLFKLTDAEVAEQKKAMDQAAADDAAKAAADQIAGTWTMLNSNGPVEKTGKGTITVAAKKGGAYPVTFDLSKGGGPSWTGVGVYKQLFGDKLFWVAYGTPKTVGLCVYEIDGGKLKGTWYPWYINGDAKNTGTEDLKGPENLDGEYTIESAKAPYTGAAYTGTVSIKPAKIVGADDHQAPYLVTWTIGGKQISGIGIRHRKFLFVASGTGADVNIAAYQLGNGSMTCDWYKAGSTEKGSAAAMSN